MKSVLIIAKREFLDAVRNRWFFFFALVFMILDSTVAYSGITGVRENTFFKPALSLLNLVLILVPLMALIMGANSFTGARESWELLLIQPISRKEAILGKYLGLGAAITATILLGFICAGIILILNFGLDEISHFLFLVILSVLLSLTFLSIASLSSIILGEKAKSIGISFMLWLWFVVIYDFILVGLTLSLGEVIVALLFLNPADLVRTTFITSLGSAALVGPAGAVLNKTFGSLTGMILSLTTLLAWLVIPLYVAIYIFERKDI
ncbi:MAG: ABC transporter permease subunit [Deltaproteobacteria bacterium]|nr:ABC transporter permease subunit [Deltaproteobacteria bacterium]